MKRYIAVLEINDDEEIIDASVSYVYRSNGTNYSTTASLEFKEESEDVKNKTYEDGLNDAWECARKIFVPVNKGGLSGRDVNLIFNNMEAPYNIFDNYSASEAIAKIKEYKENQKKSDGEITVGDEIYSLDKNYKSVVTAIFDTCRGVTAVYFTQNGKLAGDLLENLHKTGRHFPQIEEVLQKMQEGSISTRKREE